MYLHPLSLLRYISATQPLSDSNQRMQESKSCALPLGERAMCSSDNESLRSTSLLCDYDLSPTFLGIVILCEVSCSLSHHSGATRPLTTVGFEPTSAHLLAFRAILSRLNYVVTYIKVWLPSGTTKTFIASATGFCFDFRYFRPPYIFYSVK